MRIGQNPAKFVKDVATPERITVAVLNYIPFISGFYSDMMDVLKTCLTSLRQGADLPFDLMVFDNGSCEEVRRYLLDEQDQGNIQYLLFSSKNLGKGGAWNQILAGAPGEIVVYSDNDCFFYKGWLSKSLQILETFPNTGMVTARPFRTNSDFYSSTIRWSEENPAVKTERGAFIPWDVFLEFDLSLGQTEEEIRRHYESTEDTRLTYQGIQAIAGASHWQFMARKEVLQNFLPFNMDRPMGQVRQLDQRMNEAGYLRLMPIEPLVMNMSNTLRNMPGLMPSVDRKTSRKINRRWLDFPPFKGCFIIHLRYHFPVVLRPVSVVRFFGRISTIMLSQRMFISADHGLAIVYFLQSEVVPTLLKGGVEVILLTDDGLKQQITNRFGQPGLTVEGLRLNEARNYFETQSASTQWWMNFLRRVGGSKRINTEAMDSHILQVEVEAEGRRRMLMPFMKGMVLLLRNSRNAREALVRRQLHFSPDLYTDLFDRYQPSLVVASTPGWRQDRYLLRQAIRKGVPTAAVVVGWDNPSSYSIPGAPVEWINCWSEIQKEELVLGSDWKGEQVNIGGIPSYDGYFQNKWLMPKDEYFRLHNLDPQRKLLGYACSFITFSPNYQNVEALARLVSGDSLAEPSQLLVRLHPNHFMEEPLFVGERERIQQLTRDLPHVHVVEPVPLGGELGYYSGEDMPEKTSMMAYSDVFLTVYSTMVVEAAIHDRPIVSVCFDAPGGWNQAGRFSLPLSEIGNWPTHQRFRKAKAGLVAMSEIELKDALNFYLKNPGAHQTERRDFIKNECTFTDGSAGLRTGQYLLSRLNIR